MPTSVVDSPTSRYALRHEIRRLRRSLEQPQREACASALARHLMNFLRLRRAERIGCYLAQDGELDLAPLMNRLRAVGKQLYLPVLRRPRLWFMPLDAQTTLVRNRFGILEPQAPANARCAPQALDVVLAPLVAFDNRGRRLGMGGGFYDRTFAYRLTRRSWHRPCLIGIAYDLQRVSALSTRRWDVPLDGIATESGLRFFPTRGDDGPTDGYGISGTKSANPTNRTYKDIGRLPISFRLRKGASI